MCGVPVRDSRERLSWGWSQHYLPLSLVVPVSPLARLSTAMARNTFNRMSGVSSGCKGCLWTTHVPLPTYPPQQSSPPRLKDTVATDEEDDEIDAHQHPWEEGATVGHDTIIHDHVPVLARQYLWV